MNIRNIVLTRLEQAVNENSPMPFPEEMDDDVELDMFGLDSLAFMGLQTSENASSDPSETSPRKSFVKFVPQPNETFTRPLNF